VTPADTPAAVAAVDTSVDDDCFESPDGVGAGLVLDNLEVQR
jgi:hypothetical protein